jgi:hypothetical protein
MTTPSRSEATVSDGLERAFEELRPADGAEPPAELLAEARSRGAPLRAQHRRTRRNQIGAVALAAVVLLGASLTPPGRAATGWIARVAGIGEDPSLPQVGSVQGAAVVLQSGELPDGTPFEVVAKRFNGDSFMRAAADSPEELHEMQDRGFASDIPESVCFQVDWPGSQSSGQGGMCTSHRGSGREPELEASTLFAPPRSFDGTGPGNPNAPRSGPVIFMGFTTSDEITQVRVVQRDGEGAETELPSQLLTVDGESLETVGAPGPLSVFFAVLDEAVVAAANAREAQVTVTASDATGAELAHADAFPPLDCPVDPSVLVPEQPEIPESPHPATPEESAAMRRAFECGAAPPKSPKVAMDQIQLERGPLPDSLSEMASNYGYSLEPANHDQLASVFSEDFSGATARDVTSKRVYHPPEPDHGYQGNFLHVYLAQDREDDRLVYVEWQDVTAVFNPDGTRNRDIDGLPKEFLRIVDVASGDDLLNTELP